MRRRLFVLGTVAVALVIFALSMLPTGAKFRLHTQGILHPWLHLLAFGVLSFLCARSLPTPQIRVVLLLAIVALGWGTELLESLRDGWPLETRDALLDTLGVLFGGLFGSFPFVPSRRANPR